MRIQLFSIPVHFDPSAVDLLNEFLGCHRVLSIDREFVADGANSLWAICVTYQAISSATPPSRKGKVDYKEVLDPDEFVVYAMLRDLRKRVAERDGVPVYAVFTNEQLAALVRQRTATRQQMLSLSGVGPARVEKHGTEFLDALRSAFSGPGVALGSTEAGERDSDGAS
ncbi:MAG: hypothetical protein GY946_10815 [bacterium]|nr:hypothetical protein [bacterium]